MLRLIVLTALTIAAFLFVLAIYGTGGPQTEIQPPPADQVTAAEKDDSGLVPDLPDKADPTDAEEEPPADLVEVEEQTPEQIQDFPGPDLQPSPEHADDMPDPASALADAEGPVLYVTGSRVNFRAGPSTSDRVVGALDGGSPVEALGPPEGGWVQIRDMDGRTGFMSGRFLSGDAP